MGEECANPSGCSDKTEADRIELTRSDLKNYHHVPAIVQGRATVSVAISKASKSPPENQLATIVGQQFSDAFSTVMNVTATVQSAATFHKGHAVQPLEDDTLTRM